MSGTLFVDVRWSGMLKVCYYISYNVDIDVESVIVIEFILAHVSLRSWYEVHIYVTYVLACTIIITGGL